MRASQSGGPDGVERRRGRVFVLRADLLTPETRALLASVARVVLVGQRGSLADQLDRVPEPKEAERITRKRARCERGTAHRAATAGSGVLQRPRRFRGRRTRICHDPRARPVDAGTLDQCHRQSRFRLPGVGGRQRLHLVGQQPREPAHAMVERSGQRSPGRGVLSARRRHRRSVVPDSTADPRPQRCLRGAARLGLQPVRAFALTASPAELLQYVPLDDPIKISRLTLRNTSGRTRRLSVTAYVEWVLGTSRTAAAPFVTTEIDSRHRRDVRAQCHGLLRSDRGSRSPTCAGARRTGLATGGNSSAATARWRARRRSPPPAPLSNTVGAGLDPCAALRTTSVLPANSAASRSSSSSARPPTRKTRSALIARYRTGRSRRGAVRSRAALGRCPRHGPGEDARPGDGHHAERLAALSDAGLPHLGALGVLSGERRLWLPRSAAGRHGAGRGAAGDDARAPAARRGAAVRRGRRAALVAAAFRAGRAHAHLRRSRLARLRRRPLCRRDRRCRGARRGGAVPGRPAPAAGRA